MAQKEDIITMSSKQLSRLQIIQNLIDGLINGTHASKLLSLSVRQIRRLKYKIKQHGHLGVIHGNKGKIGNRKINPEIIDKATKLLHKHYHDFKPTFASEKLDKLHNIKINKETLRQIMISENLWTPKPRKSNKQYHSWRPRKEYFGEMQQFDGSYEFWFESRAPKCCLLASIDDATGKITFAQFASDEGVLPVFSFWKDYLQNLGKPLNIYLDKGSTYKVNSKHLLDDPSALTQFEKTMQQLNINIIHAYSPQAKGRVERLFGTLQDRLIKELRLANISSVEEANIFLKNIFIPFFNKKFAVLPLQKKNLHCSLNAWEKDNLNHLFSIKESRIVNNDFTVLFEKQWFQLTPSQPTLVCRKDKVLVEKHLDCSIKIKLRKYYLNFNLLPKKPIAKSTKKVIALSRSKSIPKPAPNHPWRKSNRLFLKNKNRFLIIKSN